MHLTESLLWCFYPECDLSGVQIFCEEDKKENIIADFNDIFWCRYKEEIDAIKKERDVNTDEGEDEELEFGEMAEPIGKVAATDYGVFIGIGNLSIFDTWDSGEECIKDICDSLNETLEQLYEKYKEIEIKGYIGYCWSDRHGGDCVEIELAYPQDDNDCQIYDFVGKSLAEALGDEEYIEEFYDQFIEAVSQDEEELLEVIGKYRDWIDDDILNVFIESLEDEDDETVQEFINNVQDMMDSE